MITQLSKYLAAVVGVKLLAAFPTAYLVEVPKTVPMVYSCQTAGIGLYPDPCQKRRIMTSPEQLVLQGALYRYFSACELT